MTSEPTRSIGANELLTGPQRSFVVGTPAGNCRDVTSRFDLISLISLISIARAIVAMNDGSLVALNPTDQRVMYLNQVRFIE